MNTRLLRRVQKHILKEPRRLAMGQWVQRKGEFDREVEDSYGDNCEVHSFPKCNTAGCIAGWAVLLKAENPAMVSGWRVEEDAIDLLDIDSEQASRLFYVHQWPKKFEDQYASAATPAGKARVAARRIEHFIKTKGAE